jgi:hypothetical protein
MKIILLGILSCISLSSFGMTLESRVLKLEEKIVELENKQNDLYCSSYCVSFDRDLGTTVEVEVDSRLKAEQALKEKCEEKTGKFINLLYTDKTKENFFSGKDCFRD